MGQCYAPETVDVCVEPAPVVEETPPDEQTLLGNDEIQRRLEEDGGICSSEEPSPLLGEDENEGMSIDGGETSSSESGDGGVTDEGPTWWSGPDCGDTDAGEPDCSDVDGGETDGGTTDGGATDGGASAEGEAEPAAEKTPDDFATHAAAMFPSIDKDGDGYLSEEDIDNAMMREDLSAEDAAAVAMMKRYRGNIEELSNDEFGDEDDGVTPQDIEKYREALAEVKANGGNMPEDLNGVEGGYQDSISRVNRTNGELFPDGAPKLDAIAQGNEGSCSFLSATGSMIQEGRGQDIQDMIAKNEDGSYTVSFPGKPPVTVKAPTNGEIAYGATANENGLWLTVMEKAYGQLNDDDDTVAADGSAGSERKAIETLTGHSVNVDETAFTNESTTDVRLQDALNNNRVVTASLMGKAVEGMPGDRGRLRPGHQDRHAAQPLGAHRARRRRGQGRWEGRRGVHADPGPVRRRVHRRSLRRGRLSRS
jgi:hypothetical protein